MAKKQPKKSAKHSDEAEDKKLIKKMMREEGCGTSKKSKKK